MAITKETKAKLVKDFGKNEKDCGSTEVQIAILTREINLLTDMDWKDKKEYVSNFITLK